MNIVVQGASLFSGNKGVNALTRGLITYLNKKYNIKNIKILSYTVKEKKNLQIEVNNDIVEVEEIPFKKVEIIKAYFISTIFKNKSIIFKKNEFIQLYLKSDYILDISEGDSFSDIYGIKRFIQHSLPKIICINLSKNLILLPQTLGPYKKRATQLVAKNIIKKAKKVYARDNLSRNQFNDKDVNAKIEYMYDLAFCMKPTNTEKVKEIINLINSADIIGINISALLYNGGYTQNNMFGFKIDYKELVNKIVLYLLNKGNKIILIPHVITDDFEVENDYKVCVEIYEKFSQEYKDKVFLLNGIEREDELKFAISNCKLFIGSRMHACIAAISTNVPTIPIAYSRKFIGIWKEIGLEKYVADPRNDTYEKILEKIDDCMNNYKEIGFKLSKANNVIQDMYDKFDLLNLANKSNY